MSKFQLYIQDQRVELFDDESVSLTQTIQNIRDISKVFTDFTKPFTLPASDVNNKIFRHYYRFNLVHKCIQQQANCKSYQTQIGA